MIGWIYMLNDKEFNDYIDNDFQLDEEAKDYIRRVRQSEPSRMVGAHAKNNVCSWYCSAKMGRTISTESRTSEKVLVLLLEYEEEVLEIWEQLEPVKIKYHDKNGRVRNRTYTADFLILTSNGPKIVEVKTESEIQKLILEKPCDWEEGNNKTRFLPAEEAFSKIGIEFLVFPVPTRLGVRALNVDILLQYRNQENNYPLLVDFKEVFKEKFCVSMLEIKKRLGCDNYGPIIKLIERELLFFDFDNSLLSEPESCLLVSSKDMLAALKEMNIDNKDKETFSSVNSKYVPKEEMVKKVLKMLERINSGEKSRSTYRWKKKIKEGKDKGLNSFKSLIPNYHNSGNKNKKINSKVKEYLIEYLIDIHAKQQGLTTYRSYIKYCVESKAVHPKWDPVSRKTFTRYLESVQEEYILRNRKGRRASNAASSPTIPSFRSLKSNLPFHLASIDHYKADIYLIYFSNLEVSYVAKPWVTAMVDNNTGAVLGVSLSFRDPSKISCCRVIRDCVRRHGKLPSEVIVDRGSDFRSVYFSEVFAHYGVTVSLRPAGHSRYGGEVENFFGLFKKEWLSQREGNTLDCGNAREIDKSHLPQNSVILKPSDLYTEINEYIDWRICKPKPGELISVKEQMSQIEHNFPFIGVPVKNDHEFTLVTSVDTDEYKVDYRRGIHLGEQWFYTPEIEKIRGKKKYLVVRKDPDNPHRIFALIDKNWEVCQSSKINSYNLLSEEHKFQDRLLRLDARVMRRKIADECDRELYLLTKVMDEKNNKNSVDVVNKSTAPEQKSVFDEILSSKRRELKVREWDDE